jgi:hypothetical protein
MNANQLRVDGLDLSLFDAIKSQSSPGDRRSLLTVQRATAKSLGTFVYLEIGSHLGGSIQPYVLDERCSKVYSIDPRPSQQPDDRSPGFIAYYPDNSSAKMLALLRGIQDGNVGKVECIDKDASEVDVSSIDPAPDILFIDGEHTRSAVLSDWAFCEKVAGAGATILFHDFDIVCPAILDICRDLQRRKKAHIPLKLEDNVFAIFLDSARIHSDPHLASLYQRNKTYLRDLERKARIKRLLPGPMISAIRKLRGIRP